MRTLVFLFAVVALVVAEFDEFWEPPSRRSGSLKFKSEENDTESAKKSERVGEQRDDGFKRHEHKKKKPKHDDSKEVERFSQLLEAFSKNLEAFRRDHDSSQEDERSEVKKLIRPALLSAESSPHPAKLLGRVRSVKSKKGNNDNLD